MSITIRPSVSGDEAALALVGQATFLETYAGALPAGDIIAHCRTQHAETLYAQWLGKPGYRLWLAEMEEGVRLLGNMIDCAPQELAIGMPVEVVFEAVTPEVSLPRFRRRRD